MSEQAASIAYLNGNLLPLSEAQISVLDRGFLFGDGVYEVIPCYQGRLFLLDAHLQRLQDSLDGISLANPHSSAKWKDLIERLVAANPAAAEQGIYLQVTRGADSIRQHRFPLHISATVLLMCTPIRKPVEDSVLEHRQAAITLPDQRWLRCHLKTTALLANVLAHQEAWDCGAVEALLVRDDKVLEGSSSNLFQVHKEQLITPPNGPSILPGTTRDLVLQLAAEYGIPTEEKHIPIQQLADSDELFISSATRNIYPLTEVDGKAIGDGKHAGPITRRLFAAFADRKKYLLEQSAGL